jgi:hypothetical protein
MTYFKPKNLGDVRLLLGGIDDNVPVTLTSGVQLPSTVRTVGDLRRLTAWPTKHRLVVERAPLVGLATHYSGLTALSSRSPGTTAREKALCLRKPGKTQILNRAVHHA